jgi:hypothetical protein
MCFLASGSFMSNVYAYRRVRLMESFSQILSKGGNLETILVFLHLFFLSLLFSSSPPSLYLTYTLTVHRQAVSTSCGPSLCSESSTSRSSHLSSAIPPTGPPPSSFPQAHPFSTLLPKGSFYITYLVTILSSS